jgi:hypothetical protein
MTCEMPANPVQSHPNCSEPWRNQSAANRTKVISLGQIACVLILAGHHPLLDVAPNLRGGFGRVHIERVTMK